MLFGQSGEEDDKSTMTKETDHTDSTLLSEITELRSRLRELEDDTKSSVSSTVPGTEEWSNLLKKELAKAENEKAKMEMEYMNHMTGLAVSNQKIVDDLTERLKNSEEANDILQERLSKQNGDDKENDRLRQVLEDERKGHQQEINQIQENLAQADHEIVESRQELDYLHEQIMELESDKETLFQDLTNSRQTAEESAQLLKREREASKRTTERLEKQLADKELEMNRTLDSRNDAIIQLDGQVTEMQRKLEEAQKENSSKIGEDDVRQLERRLESLQLTLQEKDQSVVSLTTQLREEREERKSLTNEIQNLQNEGSESRSIGIENVTVRGARQTRTRGDGSSQDFAQLSPGGGKVSSIARAFERQTSVESHSSAATTSAVLQRALEKEQEASKLLETHLQQEKDLSATAAADLQRAKSTISSLQIELNNEKRTTEELKYALDKEREIVSSLQMQLTNEQDAVSSLRRDLSASQASSISKEESKQTDDRLAEKEMELGALRAKVAALEAAHEELSDSIRSRQDELDKVRVELTASEATRKSTEEKLFAGKDEIENLKTQLDCVATMNAMEEEKKSEQEDREMNRLKAQIDEMLPELDRTKTEMEVIQRENDHLKETLREQQVTNVEREKTISTLKDEKEQSATGPKGQRKFDAEMNALKVELTKVQISKAELETESMTKIKELETELEALETEAEEELEILNKEIEGLKKDVDSRETEITRLENERAQLCTSMNSASYSRKDEVDELQTELIEMTSKNARQAREVEALKMKIEDYESRKSISEGKLRSRIRELEDQVDNSKQSRRYQADKQDLERFRSENLKLRESIREVNAERRSLQEKLDEISSDRHLSKSALSLKERNAVLKSENDKLNKRLRKMENSVTRFAV